MSKDAFENRLEALFAQPPRLDDTTLFVFGVEQRVAHLARWRADLMAAAWVVAGGAVLFAVASSLNDATLAVLPAALATAQDLGGPWLLPALAVGLVLGVQALEDQLARD